MFRYIDKNCMENYNKKDSITCGLLGVLCPLIASFILALFACILSVFLELTYDEILDTVAFTFISSLVVELSFAVLFYFYNRSNKINLWSAGCIKTKTHFANYIIVLILGALLPFLFSDIIGLWEYGLSAINYTITNDIGYPMSNGFELVIVILLVGILPAFCEELVFRGVVLNGLRKYGRTKAVLISALCFALMHCNMEQVVYTFILGIVFGLVVYESRSLWLSMIAHCANNTVVIISYYFSNSTSDTIVVNSEFVLYSILFAIIGVVLIIASVLLIKYFSKHYDTVANNKVNTLEQCGLDDKTSKIITNDDKKTKQYFTWTIVIGIVMLILDCMTKIK